MAAAPDGTLSAIRAFGLVHSRIKTLSPRRDRLIPVYCANGRALLRESAR